MKPFILTLLALSTLSASAAAETYTVHPVPGMGDFTSVAEALASTLVEDGDTVRVHAGTYTGTLVLSKKILLESVDGAEATVLDAGGLGTALTIEHGATVQGFEITGGGGPVSCGGVLVTSTVRATVRDCRIVENHPTGVAGLPVGGVGVGPSASALLVGNWIASNTALSVGGLFTGPMAEVDLIGNWIIGNGSAGTATGGVLFGASGRLVNNQITGNYGLGIGGLAIAGGIGPEPEGAVVDVVNCTIYGNRGTDPGSSAGGVFLDDGGVVTIVNTIIYENVGSPHFDLAASSDFTIKGTVSLSFSHVKSMGPGIPGGTDMVPGFLDPLLVTPVVAPPTGPTTLGDFHLTAPSPDVDAGEIGSFPEDASAGDLDSVLRVLGGSIDVGAFELGTSCEAPIYYGLAKISSSGERPYLIAVGEPSVSGADLHLELHGATPLSPCVVSYGFEPGFKPLHGGTLWITPTVQALFIKPTDAAGSANFGIKLDGAMIGTTRYYQSWFRDPAHPDGTGAGLSNAVAIKFCM